jgi:hypothetical protein
LNTSPPRRASLPRHFAKTNVISHVNLTSTNINDSHTPVITISNDFSANESFRKHGKILEKLNQRDQQEEFRRKQWGSLVDWSILEDMEEDQPELPKLKPNARDERQTISEPWSIVKDMQQLRNQPILVTTTRYHMIKI